MKANDFAHCVEGIRRWGLACFQTPVKKWSVLVAILVALSVAILVAILAAILVAILHVLDLD